MLAPVIVFVYNRPGHTKQTIEALAKNYLADQTEVFIFSDGAKFDKGTDKVRQVREYLESLPERGIFKSLSIEKSETNKGLARSVIAGVSQVINRYKKVIVLEDDLVTSKDFLQYMNDALSYYEQNETIWSVCGYSLPIEIPKKYEHDIYLSYRGGSWGWATWKDRWEKIDWDVADYSEFKKNTKLRNKLNRGGRDMAFMLDEQMEGKIDSWAIRWCYAQSKLEMLTIYPVKSKIRNIGLDGSGTHSGVSSLYDIKVLDEDQECTMGGLEINPIIVKNLRDYYMSIWQYYVVSLKRTAKKLLTVR